MRNLPELDPNDLNPDVPGAKLDKNKPKLFRGIFEAFPRAMVEVSKATEFGATKYTYEGWRSVDNGFERYTDALLRHLIHEGRQEGADEDSGLSHATHVAWNALARLELELTMEEERAAWAMSDAPEVLELVDRINSSPYLNPAIEIENDRPQQVRPEKTKGDASP
jgi:hypothetical protein